MQLLEGCVTGGFKKRKTELKSHQSKTKANGKILPRVVRCERENFCRGNFITFVKISLLLANGNIFTFQY